MSIPTEMIRGSVLKQLFHGTPFLVFVEHPATGKSSRCVCEVKLDGESYVPTGKRFDWQETDIKPTEAAAIVGQYLAETKL